jgi:hypothetical protein
MATVNDDFVNVFAKEILDKENNEFEILIPNSFYKIKLNGVKNIFNSTEFLIIEIQNNIVLYRSYYKPVILNEKQYKIIKPALIKRTSIKDEVDPDFYKELKEKVLTESIEDTLNT